MKRLNGSYKMPRLVLYAIVAFFSTITVLPAQEKIEEASFVAPPDVAKPNVYWYLLDDQISKAGITKDLEEMKKVGIGGVLLFNISNDNIDYNNKSAGPLNFVQPGVKFLSPPYYQMMKHAADECKRLGMEFGMHNCPGWSSSGGPWINRRPDLAMQTVTVSSTNVKGSKHFSGMLAKPPTGLGNFKLSNYWDIAVLAFPTPMIYLIENWEAKAGYERDVSIREDITVLDPKMIISFDSIIDLSSKMDSTGLLNWDVPEGDWTILRIGYTPTGARSSVPAGGHGLECDKMNRIAVKENWDGLVDNILNLVGPDGMKVVHIDSYEVGHQNWTANFRQEFQKRRGYDMTPYLPVMTGLVIGSLEISERFLWDVRQTIGDLINEEYYGYMATLAHQNGMQLSAEPYGSGVFRDISAAANLDIPMGEFWTGEGKFDGSNPWIRDPASSAHIYGKKVVAAEAFTSDFTEPGSGWQAHPYSLKKSGDLAYCSGINRFTLHVYCHQPFTDRTPGYSVRGYGVQFGWTNTWWNQSIDWMKYVGRCQYMLQKGLFVTDAIRFIGEGTPSQAVHDVKNNYDVCDGDAILNRMSVRDGRIVLPDGMNYKVLILEKSETLSYDLLKKISELVREGAIIIGKKPTRTPGLQNYPACDKALRKLANEMWGNIDGNTIRMHQYGVGKVYYNEPIANVLSKLTTPDFQVTNGDKTTDIKFTHRTTSDMEIYFLSNQNERFESVSGQFRVSGKTPEFWYPETGRIEICPVFTEKAGLTTIPLMFQPYESVFVVFRSDAGSGKQIHSVSHNGQSIHQFLEGSTPLNKYPVADLSISSNGDLNLIAWESGKYKIDRIKVNVPSIPKVRNIDGPWKVSFPPKLGAPDSAVFNTLASWTENADNGIKYFSGTATYVKEVSIPAKMIGSDKLLYLDLGDVKNIAEVEVNGQSCGILWKPPYRADITQAARKGINILKIKVTNNWPNRIIGDEVLDQSISWKTWNLFYTANSPLTE
ncbi:MAG TPA: glycosyl hydrolase, partial [Prolixibacteraceae bacterium]|nr:glycosyl hydrolase [Prolixibacteraceae bacterium]